MTGQVVQIIRRRSGFANIPDSFEVATPDHRLDELTSSVEDYILPAGFEVAASSGGTIEIYDGDGQHCCIIEHVTTGRPQLVSARNTWPVLDRIGQ